MQPDSIISDLSNPQSLNRYSYVQNNPTGYTDPTGHMHIAENGSSKDRCSDPKYCNDEKLGKDSKTEKGDGKSAYKPRPPSCDDCGPDGFQIQFSFALGLPTDYFDAYKKFGVYGGQRPGEFPNIPGLMFGGFSLVFDKYGGVQLYGLTLDQDVNFEQGPLQENYPSNMLAANATLAVGVINGKGFEERGTKAFAGQARDWSGGLGPLSYDYYQGYNGQTGQPDPNLLSGHDIGYSWGSPLSGGAISIYAHPIIQFVEPAIP